MGKIFETFNSMRVLSSFYKKKVRKKEAHIYISYFVNIFFSKTDENVKMDVFLAKILTKKIGWGGLECWDPV